MKCPQCTHKDNAQLKPEMSTVTWNDGKHYLRCNGCGYMELTGDQPAVPESELLRQAHEVLKVEHARLTDAHNRLLTRANQLEVRIAGQDEAISEHLKTIEDLRNPKPATATVDLPPSGIAQSHGAPVIPEPPPAPVEFPSAHESAPMAVPIPADSLAGYPKFFYMPDAGPGGPERRVNNAEEEKAARMEGFVDLRETPNTASPAPFLVNAGPATISTGTEPLPPAGTPAQ